MKIEFQSLKAKTIINLIIIFIITMIASFLVADYDLKRNAKDSITETQETFENLVLYEAQKLDAAMESLLTNEKIAVGKRR